MIPRYSRPEMAALFSEETKYKKWFQVEMASVWAWVDEGRVPEEAARELEAKAHFTPERIDEIEREVRHDVIAFTQAVSESVGPLARYFHYGLTSSDVTDTALALTLVEAAGRITQDIDRLRAVLRKRTWEEKDTLTVGRTHGMFAEPMVLGLKFALWWSALGRDRERLVAARQNLSFGKLSGAIGTYMEITPEVEAKALGRLGLQPAPITTQVLDRDRHAQYLSALAILAGNLEKMALEIRLLQRSEVRELREPFAPGQKGSSAMPHKQNPVVAERLSGLARLARAYAQVGFEDIPLWHERDISHSSAERVALADASILLDFMLSDALFLMDGLVIDRGRMEGNLGMSGGVVFSQKVLLALVRAGLTREDAYRVVQRAALSAMEGGDFRRLLEEDPKVQTTLGQSELAACFDVRPYLAHVPEILERTVGKGE